jgi:uncharacterized protein YigE (DUF2233 family)
LSWASPRPPDKIVRFPALFALSLAGSSLAASPSTNSEPAAITRSAELPDGLKLSRVDHRSRQFLVAELDLRKITLELYGQSHEFGTVRSFSALSDHLKASGRRLVWGTNAGIFTKNRRPLGLQIEGGAPQRSINKADGYGNFYLKPNGVFEVGAHGARVMPTDRWTGEPTLATQSGPLLLIDGALHPALRERSPNQLLRSGVGVSGPHTVVFAMSVGPVRFHELATLFGEVYHCTDALYLDGVISQWVDQDHAPGPTDGTFAGLFAVVVPVK